MGELEVLLEQLDELLGEGAVDADDALEIATVAGLVVRLGGATSPSVAAAMKWRAEGGDELLVQAFAELELDEIVDGLEAVLQGDVDEEAVEEAVYELDDLVAAAIWSGHRAAVRDLALEAARTIRAVPEPFACLADFGAQMARLHTVAADLDLYDYWLAIADSGQYADEGPGRD
jgi:hypothetical protein